MRPRRFVRPLVGEPIAVGQRTIRPVAKVTGWYTTRRKGAGGIAWAHVTPVEVVVREADGREHRIPVQDVTRTALRGMLMGAFTIALVAWLIIRLVRGS